MLWEALLEIGVPKHLVWLVRQLDLRAVGTVRVDEGKTDVFAFEKGVRQGCLLSPMVFNVVGEKIMRLVKEEAGEKTGCRVAGDNIWNIRYADDTTLLAKSEVELQVSAKLVEEYSAEFGLKINREKTNVISVSGGGSVKMGNTELAVVETFKYLESFITAHDPSGCEIRARLGIARSITSNSQSMWRSSKISQELKERLVCSLVWSVALYGIES